MKDICINKNLAFFEERFPGIMDIIEERKNTLLNNEDIEVEWDKAVDGTICFSGNPVEKRGGR